MTKLSKKQLDSITDEFYSCFCETDISKAASGVTFVCSAARNEDVRGFGCKYTVYMLVKDDICIVAYAPQYADFFQSLQNSTATDILTMLERTFPLKKMQLMKFSQECIKSFGNARILEKSDYPLYEEFFRLTSPNADPTGWLQEYFEEKTEKECFTGYFLDGRLVSVCDAPDMPYMEDRIQHTGIATLEHERRKGYAKCTAALAVHHLLKNGICPQWECRIENAASLALAKPIGYEPYGTAYILEE